MTVSYLCPQMLIIENRTMSNTSSHVLCNHDWSFLQGDKKHSHTLKAGRHFFPFHLEITGSLPSTLSTSALGGASIAYKLRAVATRPGFSHNLQAIAPVYILRSIASEALEYQQTLDIENTWPEKLMYAITLPHKAWAAGDTLTAILKFSPLAKGTYVQTILTSITETTKICARGAGSHEITCDVAGVRHEILDHRAVEVEVPTLLSTVLPGSSGTAAVQSPRNSRPASPHVGPFSSHHHHSDHYSPHHHSPHRSPHHPLFHLEEEEDLGFDTSDVVTYINIPIPSSSAYPLLYSASDVISPTPTSPGSASPTHQHAPLPLSPNSTASHLTSSSLPVITPSHGHEPILISHRIKWSIFILNTDGHVSELKCSLPIKILDGALLDESRGFTRRARRLLFRTSGLGSVLGRSEEGNEDEDDGGAEVDDEEGRIRQMEADRELPSYPAHVRDRVANMYLSESVTKRVSNPWIGRVGPASGSALSSPELSGQGELDITNPLIGVVSSSGSASADRSTPDTQLHSRASRSGRSTPLTQPSQPQVHMTSHLPHAPGSGESAPLDWVNSELLLSLSLDGEAVRRIGGLSSSVGGQQQPQQHQQQHQTHQRHQSRTGRWGSQVGSRAGSRAASPERSGLSSITTINNDSGPSTTMDGTTGGVFSSPGSIISPTLTHPGFASPFQNLFKATMKPFTALTGHPHRPIQPRSRSTTSLMGLHSSSTASGLGNSSQIHAPSGLSLTRPSSGNGGSNSSSAPFRASLQNDMNGFNPISTSSSSPSLSATATCGITAPSSSSLFTHGLETASTYSSHNTPNSGAASPVSHVHQPEPQDPYSRVIRAFSVVPDYSIASRGFIGGVPPLSSMRGLPSYEEAEAQRREKELRDREMQPGPSQDPNARNQVMSDKEKGKMKARGSMSEPDLAGRFGHGSVRFESGMQVGTEVEAGTCRGVGRLEPDGDDGDEDGDEDEDYGDAIQIRTKKARP